MRRSFKEEFVNKANKIFNNMYKYENFIYVNNYIKGLITCPIHGDFLQKANSHLDGHGCNRCEKTGKLSHEYVKECFKNVGLILLEEYINSHKKLKCECIDCNIIQYKLPYGAINAKTGCTYCGIKKAGINKRKITFETCQKLAIKNNGKCLNFFRIEKETKKRILQK